MIFRRGRFDELVDRQLELFEEDRASLLAEARRADHAWTTAAADEFRAAFDRKARKRFGRYASFLEEER